ncbi:hypothetical protein WJX72_007893 [[Myrmecia] bisecta]|uniref:Actin n=1 Tax=[Myrmecia] bisecta TaxID=41462 RepID=A0AAW1Q4C4_9CHLO
MAYGGDEVNAIVLDVGSSTVKGGYAGEDTPKAVYPSWVGRLPGSKPVGNSKRKHGLYAGAAALNFRLDHLQVDPVLQNGLYHDWDGLEALWHHAFSERLCVNPEEHPIMLAEPSHNTIENRERMCQLMFEQYQPPALFLAKNAVLSSFATGRQTSLVVDCGHEGTTGKPRPQCPSCSSRERQL